MNYIIHTDGGSRGNPGPAAIGVVIEKNLEEIAGYGKTIGETTNNVAEYTAVVDALTWMKEHGQERGEINFFLDSLLVVNQLNGLFKIKDARLRTFVMVIRQLEQEVGGVITYKAVPREQNTRADFFVNKALDEA